MNQSYSLDACTFEGDSSASVTSSEDSDVTDDCGDGSVPLDKSFGLDNADKSKEKDEDSKVDSTGATVGPNDTIDNYSSQLDNVVVNRMWGDGNQTDICNGNVNKDSGKNDCDPAVLNDNETFGANDLFVVENEYKKLIHPLVRKSSSDPGQKTTKKSCLSPPSRRGERAKVSPGKKVHWKRTTKVTLKWRRAFAMVRTENNQDNPYRMNRVINLFKSKKRSKVNFPLGKSVQEYVNPAFELGEDGGGNGKLADIVGQLMKQPSMTDIHPYGRGNLYASILEHSAMEDHRSLDDHTDSGKLISWVVVVIMVVGFAGGIVMLAITREVVQPVLQNNVSLNT